MDAEKESQDLVRRVLQGDGRAVTQLIHRLAPILLREAAIILWRIRRATLGRTVGFERDDLVQHAYAEFLRDPARLLRAWTPKRGSLDGYLAGFARNQIISLLRKQRQTVQIEDPVEPETLRNLLVSDEVDARVENQDALQRALLLIEAELSPREQELLKRCYYEQQSSAQICGEMGLSTEAFYQAMSRLRRHLSELRKKL